MKCTPQDHPDYESLQRALNLSQHNLESYVAVATPAAIVSHRIILFVVYLK